MKSILKILIIFLCGAVFAFAGFFGTTIFFNKTRDNIRRNESTTSTEVAVKVGGRFDRFEWQTAGIIVFGLIGAGGAIGAIMLFEKKQATKQEKKTTTTSRKKRKRRSVSPSSQERPVKRKRRKKRPE